MAYASLGRVLRRTQYRNINRSSMAVLHTWQTWAMYSRGIYHKSVKRLVVASTLMVKCLDDSQDVGRKKMVFGLVLRGFMIRGFLQRCEVFYAGFLQSGLYVFIFAF